MAQFTGPSISELPGWRIGLIFILFCVIAVGFDYGSVALDQYLKRRRKRALRHVVRRLQAELLVLGLLPYLLQACISCQGDDCKWDCAATEPPPGDSSGGGGGDGRRRLQLLGVLDDSGSSSSSRGGRQLLASKAGNELSCMQAEETCGIGSEPFWSQLALVQAHVLLFVIAAVHILYACVSMLLCFWKLRRWRRFEEYAMQNDLRPLSSRFLPRPCDNPVTHALRCAGMMLADSVTADVYHGLRRLFIERLDVERSFNFHGFVVESMEEEFASIVGVHAVLWLFVLLWIMLPTQSWVMVWMSGLAVIAAVVVAIKLQSIITLLAQDAYELYGNRSEDKPPAGMLQSMKHRLSPSPSLQGVKQHLQRLSPFSGVGRAGASNEGILAAGSGGRASPHPGGSQRGAQRGPQAPPQKQASPQQAQQAQQQQQVAAAVRLSSPDGSSSEEECDSQVVSAAAGLVQDGASPQDATAVAAAASAAAQHEAKAQAASVVGRGSQGVAAAAGDGRVAAAVVAPAPAPGLAGAHARLVKPSQMQEQLETDIGVELDIDLEAQAHPGLAARLAGDAARGAHPRSSVFRRCCPWLVPHLPGHKKRTAARAHAAVRRSESFSESYRGPDAASLFWGGRPQVMLQIIRAVYFWNSLGIASAIFSVWQDVTWDWHRYGGWVVIGIMIGVELLLWLFLSLMVLPVYALTTAAGSHSAASVIQHALKKQVKPDLARALQRMSRGMHDGPPPADGGAHAAPQQEQQGVAAAASRTPSPRPGPGGPPRLSRHSAPVPGVLVRLSPTLLFFPPAAGSELQLSSFGSPLGGSALQAAGSADVEPLSTPDHSSEAGEASEGSEGVEVDADAMVAAAETAALPRSPKSEAHLSLTRLMGAMYKRQLRRHLEQASTRRALHRAATSRPPPQADESWRGGHSGADGAALAPSPSPDLPAAARGAATHGATARFAEPSPLATLQGAAGEAWREGAATETCPPAVGTAWLPDLLQQLSGGQAGAGGVGAPAGGAGRQANGAANGGSGASVASPSESRPSLAQVRSLFAEGAAGNGTTA